MEYSDLIKNGLDVYGIEADNTVIERFEIYKNMLLEWNKKMNLTAITDERDVYIKHFLDSVSCVQSGIDFAKIRVIDVGTGAGFPGVPLLIVFNDMKLTLLDSLNKRLLFLAELTKELGITCEIVHGRAEDYGVKNGYRESYDVALSRAVANMSVLSEYLLPYVKLGGVALCQKGPGAGDEVKAAKKAISTLGGKLEKIVSTNVYNSDFNHHLVIIEKVDICPGKYPRKAGLIEKKPII